MKMVQTKAIIATAALLAALPVNAGLYPKSSKVVQVDAKNYDRLIAQSNYTSIVEFYAPWCGHCKNLQPAYEKAANNLLGLAKVAAVDCDEESNKPFCGGFGVQGFPTLKIIKPGKTPGKPIVEDYNGARSAKGIVEAVIEKIPNHVKRIDDKGLEAWLAEADETPKAILFTEKGTTSALIKSVAIEFKDTINVAQIRNTQKGAVELFEVTKFPTLILLPGGKEAKGLVYDGEMKKEAMVAFLSQAANPHPDPAPPKVKKSKPKADSKKASKAKDSFAKSSASQASAEGATGGPSATDETLVEEATESPSPEVKTEKPAPIPAEPIPILFTAADLVKECMGRKTGTCVLALLPPSPDAIAAKAVGALSEIAHKAKIHHRQLFPFYVLPESNSGYEAISKALGFKGDTEIIAINGKRGWYKKLPLAADRLSEADVTEEVIENWVESIKLGEGAKQKLPEGLIPEEPEVAESVEEAQEPLRAGEKQFFVPEGMPEGMKIEVEEIHDHDEL